MGDLFNRLSFPFLFLQNLAVRRGASVTLCPSKKKTSNFQLPNLHWSSSPPWHDFYHFLTFPQIKQKRLKPGHQESDPSPRPPDCQGTLLRGFLFKVGNGGGKPRQISSHRKRPEEIPPGYFLPSQKNRRSGDTKQLQKKDHVPNQKKVGSLTCSFGYCGLNHWFMTSWSIVWFLFMAGLISGVGIR